MSKTNRPALGRSFATLPLRPSSAIPSLDKVADLIGAHMVADAIEAYRRAKHRSEVINDRVGFSGPQNYIIAAQRAADLAADALAYAIVAYHVAEVPCRGLKDDDPALGVTYKGTLYTAAPDPERFAGLSVVTLKPDQDPAADLASVVNLDDFFGVTVYSQIEIDCLRLATVGTLSQPQPSHVAALDILGKHFRLSFWTEQDWRALPAGVYRDHYFKRLSGFGVVGLDLVDEADNDEWLNTINEAYGERPPFPDARKLRDVRLHVGPDQVAELFEVVEAYGVEPSTQLIKKQMADRKADRAYLHAAHEADFARREEERAEDPIGFRVTEEDVEQYYIARRGITADAVVAEVLEDATNAPFDSFRDQAVWRGNRLIAVISHGPDGRPAVTRFDRPADDSPAPSAFDLGELAGVEIPTAEVALLNAPPATSRVKRKTKTESKPRAKPKAARK